MGVRRRSRAGSSPPLTVDARGDAPVITDGPYSESKEYLGGFWIIEAADLDEALEWASVAGPRPAA